MAEDAATAANLGLLLYPWLSHKDFGGAKAPSSTPLAPPMQSRHNLFRSVHLFGGAKAPSSTPLAPPMSAHISPFIISFKPPDSLPDVFSVNTRSGGGSFRHFFGDMVVVKHQNSYFNGACFFLLKVVNL